MKILITGGAGFIGSHLADACLQQGNSAILIDNLSTGRLQNIEHLKGNSSCTLVIDSILNRNVMNELVSESDLIFHMAAAVGVKYILENPFTSLETNAKGTEILLELAQQYRKRIVIASTSEVYGKHETAPLREDSDLIYGPPSKWRWSYAAAKLLDEYWASAYYRTFKLPTICVRLFNTVGPRQTGFYGMVLPRFVQQALKNEPLTVYGTGKQRRAFTYIDDVVEALLKLVSSPQAYGETINIGGQEEISIEELAKRVIQKTGSHSEVIKIPYEEAYGRDYEDMPRRLASVEKLEQLTGLKPKTGLEEILDRTIHYYKETGSQNG